MSAYRLVFLNNPERNKAEETKFVSNFVTTSKYSVITFVPKFLYEQFSRYANLFFLFTACIQQIPGVSPTTPLGTIVPLMVVLTATGIKELVEDVQRHKMDWEINNRKVLKLRGSGFVPVLWKDVEVGDILRIENDGFFPADLLLLSSSEPDGLSYVETANLDGETNLKLKQARKETAGILTPGEARELHGAIKCELPNNSLYTFEGVLCGDDGEEIPLDPSQILLRGCQLRNTPWLYGVVIFTGYDTKLFRNATAAPIKRTGVERFANFQIIFLFGILLFLSVFCAVANFMWSRDHALASWYLEYSPESLDNESLRTFSNILTFIILLNNLIPISLIVSMEVVKFQLGTFINYDLGMYNPSNDTPASARTSSLIEELGQVEYVFSDKTGTLTENKMVLKKISVASQSYIEGSGAPDTAEVEENDPVSPTTDTEGLHEIEMSFEGNGVQTTMVEQTFEQMMGKLKLDPQDQQRQMVHLFMTMMAVCHTVIPEDDPKKPGQIKYQASSPDEAAIVKGAKELDYEFIVRKPESILIRTPGEVVVEYKILAVLEFTSARKRMSVITRTKDGRLFIYIKGADTMILERLAGEQPYLDATLKHLENYASDGLRTLCFAYREISEDEYTQWNLEFQKANTAMSNRAGELEKVAELIEKDFFLVGATAVEDKLQDGVPETIHILGEAGIKVWVLTGDRQETAINIGYSCKLLIEEMTLIICNEESKEATLNFLQQRIAELDGEPLAEGEEESLGFIIDGKSLKYALENDVKEYFLNIGKRCKAVICCRVSPMQKAQVVLLVKETLKAITLAIGDGANDVGMIQAAHIGIGISGEEGLQAVRASDYAIAQFRFLRRLLLVHGSWAYNRMSKLILYSFYKNIGLYMIQFWFTFYNGFSGQIAYDDWALSLYNVLFTCLPPMMIGVFDQHISSQNLMKYPELYKYGQKKEFFNAVIFWTWIFSAIIDSLIVFGLSSVMFGDGLMLPDGTVADLWFFGTTIFSINLLVVTSKAALSIDFWSPWTHISIWGSVVLWFVFIFGYGSLWPSFEDAVTMFHLFKVLLPSSVFWLSLIIFPVICLLLHYAAKYYRRTYRPQLYDVVQEIQKYNLRDKKIDAQKFTKTIRKLRIDQRTKRSRGFAFSQNDSGQADLVRKYDTTVQKPDGL